jgi:hypothetical protein
VFPHEERPHDVPDPERDYRTKVLPAELSLDADNLSRLTAATDL